MVKKRWIAWIGFFFTLMAGTLNHFLYEWSGSNKIVAIFSATNESTWEHLKLLVTPMLLFGILEYFLLHKEAQNFVAVRVASIWIGMAVIITSFYTYKGIVGENFLWADIGTFVLGAGAAYWFGNRRFGADSMTSKTAQVLGWLSLVVLIGCFAVFTFYPPRIGLFAIPPQVK